MLRIDLCVVLGYKVSAAGLKHSKHSVTEVMLHFESQVVSFCGFFSPLGLPGYQQMRDSVLILTRVSVRNIDSVCCGGYQFEQY